MLFWVSITKPWAAIAEHLTMVAVFWALLHSRGRWGWHQCVGSRHCCTDGVLEVPPHVIPHPGLSVAFQSQYLCLIPGFAHILGYAVVWAILVVLLSRAQGQGWYIFYARVHARVYKVSVHARASNFRAWIRCHHLKNCISQEYIH